jgi:hypothetical protein
MPEARSFSHHIRHCVEADFPTIRFAFSYVKSETVALIAAFTLVTQPTQDSNTYPFCANLFRAAR